MSVHKSEQRARELCSIVKDEIQSRGITQATFAERMGVSIATLKRWLGNQGTDLTIWNRMLDELGLSFPEVMAKMTDRNSGQVEYTLDQERALASEEGLLAFFNEMLLGKSPKEIAKKNALGPGVVVSYLRRLADLELIEWFSGEEAVVTKRFKNTEPRWRKGGPLSKEFRPRLVEELLSKSRDSETFRMGLYALMSEDVEKLKTLVSETFEFARQAEVRARFTKRAKSGYAMTSFIEEFEPEFLVRIPNRRPK
ncbi:MAG: helix-turn-helix transcriptional regulator [Bdellovibrionota bacterium]